MTFGRLSIHKPYLGFAYTVGSCGCKILELPIGVFTWHDRSCFCGECLHFVCKCDVPPCPASEE